VDSPALAVKKTDIRIARVADYAAAEKSDATWRAYQSDCRQFHKPDFRSGKGIYRNQFVEAFLTKRESASR
jgi:hypothetical protein